VNCIPYATHLHTPQTLQPPKVPPTQARLIVASESSLEFGDVLGSGAFGTVYEVREWIWVHLVSSRCGICGNYIARHFRDSALFKRSCECLLLGIVTVHLPPCCIPPFTPFFLPPCCLSPSIHLPPLALLHSSRATGNQKGICIATMLPSRCWMLKQPHPKPAKNCCRLAIALRDMSSYVNLRGEISGSKIT